MNLYWMGDQEDFIIEKSLNKSGGIKCRFL